MIKWIILHCSATEEGRDFRLADIDRWHRQRGFVSVGYNYVVDLDGTIEEGRAEGAKGAHCLHYNDCSIGICYIGGLRRGMPCDTRTAAQREALRRLVGRLLRKYPEAKVCGHRDLDPHKACPCFDVKREWG